MTLASFVRPHLSIEEFDPIDLPSFAVLTGVNGAGKTHFLTAIFNGAVRYGEVPMGNIAYYHYDHLKMSGEPTNRNAWHQAANQVFGHFGNLRSRFENVFRAAFAEHDDVISLSAEGDWLELRSDARYLESWKKYDDEIEELFKDDSFRHLRSMGLPGVAKSSAKPFHLIKQLEFGDLCASSNSSSMLKLSVSALFSRYQIMRAKWMFQKWAHGGVNASREELEQEFELSIRPPWEILNELLQDLFLSSGSLHAPRFRYSPPNASEVMPNNWGDYFHTAEIIDVKSGDVRSYNSLSSGEKTIISLVVATYESCVENNVSLLLLDEIDASLHPSMVRAMLTVIQKNFVDEGVSVILASHSPTTVALCPEKSLFVVNSGGVQKKIEPTPRELALELVTEGFATLSDGAKLLFKTTEDGVFIMSEGRNTNFIQAALEKFGPDGVQIITGLESKTGKDQLRLFAELIKVSEQKGTTVFVFDPDVSGELPAGDGVMSFKLSAHPNNSCCKSGIEALFPDHLFEGFLTKVEKSCGEVILKFDESRKRDFEDFVLGRNKDEDFEQFRELCEILREVVSR